ncbi:hypothetical protein BN946_scf184652.g26 [Trametes cinnabarina]|uniref:Vacuole protein n=1 Tax=Pycnoporus cinnabarinus TaxID=5643 RepID=A0A060S8U0_PYCCI|nr:hypothetical protein BN946_scf184652.g26 [Trametes cinnabarina]
MCKTAHWKREVVPDHKFDFIDTREFRDNGCGMRLKYLWLYIGVLISFLVYVSDIFTAVTMLTTTSWSNAIFNSCPPDQSNGCVYIPFSIGRWLFFGCVVFSFLLLAYEAYKAKKIIQSRDISYAFTNVMANKYYSLRSYDHFCFFNHIAASTKRMDDFAFFVFFTFKSWKRLLFADGPRQSINALTLYAFYLSKEDDGPFWQLSKYFDGDILTSALTVSTAFTVFIFLLSLLMLIIAGICYIPLLCHIQGNLKVNRNTAATKLTRCASPPPAALTVTAEILTIRTFLPQRISEIIKRRNKQRLAKAAALAKKEAAGDFSHLKNKKGELIAKPLPQPTLPNHGAYGAYDSFDPYRAGSVAPDYRSGSVAPPDYRSGSIAPDYRSASVAPDYRSASTAPYSQQQQYQQQAHGQYQQEEYPNPYSPGPQHMFQPAQHGHGYDHHQQQYQYQQQQQQQQQYQRYSGGSDGYDYSAGHAM